MSLGIILLIAFFYLFVVLWMLKLVLVTTDRFGGLWDRAEIARSGEYTGVWFPVLALLSAITCAGMVWCGLNYPEQTGGPGGALAIVSFFCAVLFLSGRGPGAGG